MGGLREWLGFEPRRDDVALAEVVHLPPTPGDVAQVQHLPPAVAQAYGINLQADTVTREQAMSVPAVRRGRQIICGTLGTAPLICVRSRAGRDPERVDRPFLNRPDPDCARSYTMTMTLDALLFQGIAWWQVTSRGADGFPLTAQWVAGHRVTVDTTAGRVRFDGRPVKDRDVIRFDAPDEGILKHGSRAIKTALLLEEAVRRFATMPIPLGFLKDKEKNLMPQEVQELLDAFESSRRHRVTGYLPRDLDYDSPEFDAVKIQLGQARDHQSADIARLMNLPPAAVNAPSGDSMTYANTESNRRELVDLTFAPYVAAVQDRLSMPDVTPLGTQVFMDLGVFQRGDTNQVMTAAKAAIEAGVLTVNEIRRDWLNLPPLPVTTTPAEAPEPDPEESSP